MKRYNTSGKNRFARYGLKAHTVTTSFHSYRGGVRR